MKNSLILYLLFITFISCSPKDIKGYDNEIDKVKFADFVKRSNLNYNNFKKIIIIPNAGCSGCISDAEKSFIKNYKNTDTLYIFTAIADMKLFKNTLPNKALSNTNVIIDTNSTLITMGFKSIYPSTIEDGSSGNLITKSYQNK